MAHEIRAFAATLSSLASVAMADFLTAASGHSHMTFTAFYLRDMTFQYLALGRRGPIVDSYSVVNFLPPVSGFRIPGRPVTAAAAATGVGAEPAPPTARSHRPPLD